MRLHAGSVMKIALRFRPYLLLGALVCAPLAGDLPGAEPDGQHDFDFEIGAWKIHLKRLVHPLTGSHTWVEFDGTSVTRKVWGGRANIEEFKVDSPATNSHIEGMTLRLF